MFSIFGLLLRLKTRTTKTVKFGKICFFTSVKTGLAIDEISSPLLGQSSSHLCSFHNFDISLRFKTRALRMRVRSKIGAKLADFFTPRRIGESWWRFLWEFFMRHLWSKQLYTFYPTAIGRLVTLRAGGWTVTKHTEVKHIACGSFVADG